MFTRTASETSLRALREQNDERNAKMKKRRKRQLSSPGKMIAVAAFLIIGCFLLVLPLQAFAESDGENSAVGVKPGDWVKYSFSEWDGSVDWVKVEVQNVSGTNVIIFVFAHFPDGREYEDVTISIDVEEGWIEEHPYSPYGVPYILAENLSLEDYALSTLFEKLSISPEAQLSWNYSIDCTVDSRRYGEAVREVLLITQSYELPFVGYVMNFYEEFCWDKATGLLLEQETIGYIPETVTNVTQIRLMRIADTNLWEMPHPSIPWVQITLATVIPAATIIVVMAFREKRNNKKREL